MAQIRPCPARKTTPEKFAKKQKRLIQAKIDTLLAGVEEKKLSTARKEKLSKLRRERIFWENRLIKIFTQQQQMGEGQ
tara:strand:+ start:121 stop:354 length:234 start_codon:yes stop_codon:yes gene_type:complete